MARRYRNFRKSGGFRSRASGWYGRRSRRTKGILGVGLPYVAGIVLGLTDFDKVIPAEIKLGVACLPGNMVKGLGPARSFAQGLVIGDVIQARTGFTLGGSGGNGGSSGGSY